MAGLFDFYRKDINLEGFGIHHPKSPLGAILSRMIASASNVLRPIHYAEFAIGAEGRLQWDGWACMAKMLLCIEERMQRAGNEDCAWNPTNTYEQFSLFFR